MKLPQNQNKMLRATLNSFFRGNEFKNILKDALSSVVTDTEKEQNTKIYSQTKRDILSLKESVSTRVYEFCKENNIEKYIPTIVDDVFNFDGIEIDFDVDFMLEWRQGVDHRYNQLIEYVSEKMGGGQPEVAELIAECYQQCEI